MKHVPHKPNFIYPDNITDETYTFGGGQIEDPILREDGDFRDFVPEAEEQNKYGVESSGCYVEAQQHDIASIQEELWGLTVNYAARFNTQLSKPTPYGGNPLLAAESIRKDGLIPESMLPFDESIGSWDEFNSWKGGNEKACRAAGKLWLERWSPQYHVVFQMHESVEEKYRKLREALKRGPVAISMYAWIEIDGVYMKEQGQKDTHLTLAVYMDPEGYVYVWDTYSPFLKKIAPNTSFDFAMQWSIKKLPEKKRMTFWQMVIETIKNLWK